MKYEIKVYLAYGSAITVAPKICHDIGWTFSCCGKQVQIRDGHEEEDCLALAAHRCKEAA
jgi:hypothetical protein